LCPSNDQSHLFCESRVPVHFHVSGFHITVRY